MLNHIDSQRLEKIKRDISLLNIRFPVATIAKRTGYDKGNISKMVRGNLPCSDNFLNRFYAVFQDELNMQALKITPKEVQVQTGVCSTETTQSEKLKTIATTLSELATALYSLT